ncbi:MAG TPA: AbrB/MazE/SpoVT family DNA-binding domain-containing protein [Terracidiphilus sp.]
MATAVKVISIGNSTGVILPKEALVRLNIQKGDTLYMAENDQGIQLTPYDEEFGAKMKVAEDIARRYRDAFKKLAE